MSEGLLTTTLGELCQLVRGTSATLKTEPGEYPLVVTASYRRSANTFQLEGPAVCIPLISSTGHGDAALHRVHYEEGRFALANLLVALLPRDPSTCDGKYLYHLLNTKRDQYFVPLMLGTANVSLKEKDIAGVRVSLPPLPEQRRIVARIEELAAKIDETKGLRQQASVEADALFEVGVGTTFLAVSSTQKRPLKSLTSKIGSGSTPSGGRAAYPSTGVPFIRSLNVRMRRFQWDGIAFINETTHQEMRGTHVKPNDVLLNITGASIGRVACAPPDLLQGNVNQHVAIIRTNEALYPRYLMYWLSQPTTQEIINDEQKGATRQGYTKAQIEALVLPLPSLREQQAIVIQLDGLQAKVDALKQLQAETAAELAALLPSVLDRAFSGRL